MANQELGGEEVHASTHRLLFFLCSGALAAALFLGVFEPLMPASHKDGFPVACAFRRATGTPCPGCGLTRSWIALGRGAFGESLSYHRLGWVVMLFVALQVLRHAAWLQLRSFRSLIDRHGKWLDRSLALLALALFVNWGFVLAGI
ncbi:MAG: DUF2752 domain-containing protein [Thermoanaerobaculales bacterium]|nr:DUF2752 domain-containing protein [Thermoanaerobaculales bacterium]